MVRIILCVAAMTVVWLGASYILTVFIGHQEFTFKATYVVVPIILGIVEAFLWKPKE